MKLIPSNMMQVLAWNINAATLFFFSLFIFFIGCNFTFGDMDPVKDIPV